jgi:hypothetical protein
MVRNGELELPRGSLVFVDGEVHLDGGTTVYRVKGPMIEVSPELVWDSEFQRFRSIISYGEMRMEYHGDLPYAGWVRKVSGGELLDDACYVVSDISCCVRNNILLARYRRKRLGLWRVLDD